MVNPATFEISSTYEEVRRAAGWLRENVAGALQPDRIDDLEFATVEALTNIVRHAYADAPGQPINLTLQLGQERLDLLIRDKGRAPPQDLLDRGPPDDDDLLNQMAEFGRGVRIIQGCVDHVTLERKGAETFLCLTILHPVG